MLPNCLVPCYRLRMTRKARIPAKTKPGDRFTVQQVLAIRSQAQQGHTQAEIARAYRCSEMSIYRLLAGKTYKRVRSDVDAPALPEAPLAQARPSPAASALLRSTMRQLRPKPQPHANKDADHAATARTDDVVAAAPPKTETPPAEMPPAQPSAWSFNTPQPERPDPALEVLERKQR